MSEIEWSPAVQHDGSAMCPESARGVRTQVKQNHDWDWVDADSNGEFWPWHKVVCYRIPMADYKRITGMPDWSEAPEWATHAAQNGDGQWFFLKGPVEPAPETDSRWFICKKAGSQAGKGTVLGDWRDTLQERPSDPLHTHPDSELDADHYSVGADTIDDSDDQPPRSKYHREIAPGVWVDVYDVLKAWSVTNSALQHLIKKALAPGERGHKNLEQDMRDIMASAKRAQELA